MNGRRVRGLAGWLAAVLIGLGATAPGVWAETPEKTPLPAANTPAAKPAATTTPASKPAVIRSAPALATAKALPAALEKPTVETPADLKILQEQVKSVVTKVSSTVVGLRVGGGQGSGVIITDDGYVMTAGHVNGAPGREVTVMLHDGKSVKAKSLGVNYGIDSGLVKIDSPGPLPGGKWPFAEIAKSGDLKRGQWCIALGHPGGYKASRTPPLRLGKVLTATEAVIRTDCTLVGGDSGGPLFDLMGRVIGIHSRIGGGLADNMHVPADTYRDTWARLAGGESWGLPSFVRNVNAAYLGIQIEEGSADCTVGEVYPESPAAKAGLKAGDVITGFDGQRIANFGELMLKLGKKRPGEDAALELKRGIETVKVKATLAKRPESVK